MNIDDVIDLILYAQDAEDDKKLFDRWVIGGLQFSISFDEFKQRLMRPKDERTSEEILTDVKNILDNFEM